LIVVDASVTATALADDNPDGERIRARLAGESLVAPAVIDLEVLSVWRRQIRRGILPAWRAERATSDLVNLAIWRVAHTFLLPRCWQLRENVTAYDAAYVVLAEVLDVPLLTADERLARASGPRCRFEVIP
jgi:predicted nucleic acid-binding protein